MPTKFRSSQDWLEQSKLLVQARPDTTKVTTKYALKLPKTNTKPKRTKTKDGDEAATAADAATTTTTDTTDPPAPEPTPTADDDAAAPKKARGVLVLKTYDPVSGVVLKYRTTKAAEVTRLISALAQLSRTMAGLPDEQADAPMPDAATAAAAAVADEAGKEGGAAAESSAASQPAQQAQPAQGGGGGGGGKKRKKGKK